MTRLLQTTAVSLLALFVPSALAQLDPRTEATQIARERAEYQAKMDQILSDRSAYVSRIVTRWESAAQETGRWVNHDEYTVNLTNALMALQPENLMAAGDAESYMDMMRVLATGTRIAMPSADGKVSRALDMTAAGAVSPQALGDTTADLVYTPITPCRMFDTRNAGGALSANVTRTFDADGANFSTQGGSSVGCGVPYGVARAVAITLTVTSPSAWGWLTAWGLGTMPTASVLNFNAGETVANTTILPIVPGVGNDFSLNSSSNAHYIGDVVGYFAAPVATALDCTSVSSSYTAVPVNSWTAVDAQCPTGRTATGGGYYVNEGTLGFPGVWVFSYPYTNGWRAWVDNQTSGTRQVAAWARCCRVPGR